MGHRDPDRPGPEPARGRLRGGARRSGGHDHHDRPRPPPCPATRRPPRRSPPIPPVPEGEATARIQIPAIGVDKIVVEGVSLADLKKGPGPLPGDAAARPGGQRRHRRPPHHLRRPVQPPRRAEAGRRDHRHHRAGRVHLRGDRDAASCRRPRWTCSRTRATTGSRCRPAIRSTAPGSASSSWRSSPRTRCRCRARPSRGRRADPSTTLDDIDGEGAPAWPAIAPRRPVRRSSGCSPGWWAAAGGSGRLPHRLPVLPGGAVLLLRGVQPPAAQQLLSRAPRLSARGTPGGGAPGRRRCPPGGRRSPTRGPTPPARPGRRRAPRPSRGGSAPAWRRRA